MTLELNIKAFLNPFAGPNPAGEDLRYTAVYDQIKEAKRADDQLDRGEWQTHLKVSDWRLTAKFCNEALTQKSKDLQIAAWFTESLLHLYGFAGLAFGLELVRELMTRFWETLYPEVEDGDLDYRVGPITYLNEKSAIAVMQVPICDPDHTRGYSCFGWEESRLVGFDIGLGKERRERRQAMIAEGKVSGEEFKQAVNLSPIGFYNNLRHQLAECRYQFKALDDVINEKFVLDPPGLTKVGNAVDKCVHVIDKIYSEKQKSEVVEEDSVNEDQKTTDSVSPDDLDVQDVREEHHSDAIFSKRDAITDISDAERAIWKKVAGEAGNGHLKNALDQLMAAAALAPSVRQKNRYLLLVAKLCLRAGRPDLAEPIVEKLYEMIEKLNLDEWEHPAWIADVIETLYRCLEQKSDGPSDRAVQLFQKLCTLNTTKAATYRLNT
jgi:type VI secretion system protein ImpA